jgi:hypothetical protein
MALLNPRLYAITLVAAVFFCATACHQDPNQTSGASDQPQTVQVVVADTAPEASDLPGTYYLVSQTVNASGLAAMGGKISTIELRADGSFTANHVPPVANFPGNDFFNTLISGSGTYTIGSMGSIDGATIWGVYLKGDVEFESPVLAGALPKYQLTFVLGDPDSHQNMNYAR